MTERVHAHNWHQFSPAMQAAIDREMAKTRPAEDLDREHCRRLATLLGLRPVGGDDGA